MAIAEVVAQVTDPLAVGDVGSDTSVGCMRGQIGAHWTHCVGCGGADRRNILTISAHGAVGARGYALETVLVG